MLAYQENSLISDVKGFTTLEPGPIVLKLFSSVIYECYKKTGAFGPDRLFHPILMFVSQPRNRSMYYRTFYGRNLQISVIS